MYLIDGDDGILLLETTFRDLKKIKELENPLISGFFNEINETINNIQAAMAKGRRFNEMTRVLKSEDSTIIIYYHPLSRVLFCSVSDADDDVEKMKSALHKIGSRFWKKHQSDLKLYRTTTEKKKLQSFSADIENLTLGGRIAEVFPKLLVVKSVLEKIKPMGMISDFEFQVALRCTGENSPLKLARMMKRSQSEILKALENLEELDIIEIYSG